MRTFKVGYTIYHGSRYWKTEGLGAGEVLGWNTHYVPYTVFKITPKRIGIDNCAIGEVVWLKRDVMERLGKQYHSRFHEYFYAEKPAPDSQDWNWEGSKPPQFRGDAHVILGLPLPFTREQVRRAYKRLAKDTHPDRGGDNASFIRLKQAHDSALKFAVG